MTNQQTWRYLMRQWAMVWRSGTPVTPYPLPKKLWRHSHWYNEMYRVIGQAGVAKGKISHPALEAAIRCRDRSKTPQMPPQLGESPLDF